MDIEKERAEFEAWVEQRYRPRHGDDWRCVMYTINHGDVAWEAWKAARQPAEQPSCRYPLCQSEAEQDRIAAEIHAELFLGKMTYS